MEKIKVLLVDDDLNFGNTAVLLLKKAGYEVYFQNTLFGVESLIKGVYFVVYVKECRVVGIEIGAYAWM